MQLAAAAAAMAVVVVVVVVVMAVVGVRRCMARSVSRIAGCFQYAGLQQFHERFGTRRAFEIMHNTQHTPPSIFEVANTSALKEEGSSRT